MDGVKQQDSSPQNDSTLGFKWIIKIAHNILCSHIFIIHNDHTYITGDYTKLCLNIICNQSFFYFEMMSALFRSMFYTRMNKYWDENISIYRMRKLLFTILR
jgi:hypothetical protein